jgi:flagellar biosynthesis protein FlhF
VALGANLLLATKLDAARRIGSVLAAAEAGCALAEAGIGAGAADGMVPFTPDLLARRLMQAPAAAHPAPEAVA